MTDKTDIYADEVEKENLEYLIDKIIEYKFNQTQIKFNNKFAQGYYSKDSQLDMINFMPEAFFTEFKKYAGEAEIYEMLIDNNLVADDGFLYDEDGARARIENVIEATIEPDICQKMTERYLRNNFGDNHALRYKTNFENQKKIAFEAFSYLFLHSKTEPNYERVAKITAEDLSKAVLHDNTGADTNAKIVIYNSNEKNKAHPAYGAILTSGMATIMDRDFNKKTYAATFSTMSNLKHYLNSPKYVEQIKERIEDIKQINEDLAVKEMEKFMDKRKNSNKIKP